MGLSFPGESDLGAQERDYEVELQYIMEKLVLVA